MAKSFTGPPLCPPIVLWAPIVKLSVTKVHGLHNTTTADANAAEPQSLPAVWKMGEMGGRGMGKFLGEGEGGRGKGKG